MEIAQFHRPLSRQLSELTAGELAELTAALTLRKVKKRQFIVQPRFPADHRIHVVQGAFRAYVVDPTGMDHTIHFAIEDW